MDFNVLIRIKMLEHSQAISKFRIKNDWLEISNKGKCHEKEIAVSVGMTKKGIPEGRQVRQREILRKYEHQSAQGVINRTDGELLQVIMHLGSSRQRPLSPFHGACLYCLSQANHS